MAKREVFPVQYETVLKMVGEKGSHTVVFDSEAKCAGERLKFYRFLATVRADPAHPSHSIAMGCSIGWRKDTRPGHAPLKRVLVVEYAANGASEWLASDEAVEEIEKRAEIER